METERKIEVGEIILCAKCRLPFRMGRIDVVDWQNGNIISSISTHPVEDCRLAELSDVKTPEEAALFVGRWARHVGHAWKIVKWQDGLWALSKMQDGWYSDTTTMAPAMELLPLSYSPEAKESPRAVLKESPNKAEPARWEFDGKGAKMNASVSVLTVDTEEQACKLYGRRVVYKGDNKWVLLGWCRDRRWNLANLVDHLATKAWGIPASELALYEFPPIGRAGLGKLTPADVQPGMMLAHECLTCAWTKKRGKPCEVQVSNPCEVESVLGPDTIGAERHVEWKKQNGAWCPLSQCYIPEPAPSGTACGAHQDGGAGNAAKGVQGTWDLDHHDQENQEIITASGPIYIKDEDNNWFSIRPGTGKASGIKGCDLHFAPVPSKKQEEKAVNHHCPECRCDTRCEPHARGCMNGGWASNILNGANEEHNAKVERKGLLPDGPDPAKFRAWWARFSRDLMC